MDDLDPTAAWERAQAALDEVDEVLAQRAPPFQRREWSPPEPARAMPRQPAPAQPQQPAQGHAEFSASWNKWAIEVIDGRVGATTQKWVNKRLEKFAEHMAEATIEHLQKRFTRSRQLTNERVADVEDRMTKSEDATVQLIMELERRLAELEQRAMLKPIKPKLVGSDDAG